MIAMSLVVGAGSGTLILTTTRDRLALDLLRDNLASTAPVQPAPELAGRIVHAHGWARPSNDPRDGTTGAAFRKALHVAADRQEYMKRSKDWITYRWRSRSQGRIVPDTIHLGDWALDPRTLGAAWNLRRALRPGIDFTAPSGWHAVAGDHHIYRHDGPFDPARPPEPGDLRVSYTAIDEGPLYVVAAVGADGRTLRPFRFKRQDYALLSRTPVDAAGLLDQEAATLEARRLNGATAAFLAFCLHFALLSDTACVPRLMAWLACSWMFAGGVVGATLAGSAFAGFAGGILIGFASLMLAWGVLLWIAVRRNAFSG